MSKERNRSRIPGARWVIPLAVLAVTLSTPAAPGNRAAQARGKETPGPEWLPVCAATAGSYVLGDGSAERPGRSRVQTGDVRYGAGFDCTYYPPGAPGPSVGIYVGWATPRNPGRAFLSCERKNTAPLSVTSEKHEAYGGVQGPAQSEAFLPAARALLQQVEKKLARRCGAPVAPAWKPGDPIPGVAAAPPSSGAKRVELAVSWTMPRRFGIVGRDGMIDYAVAPKDVVPMSFRVELIVRPKVGRQCRADDRITLVAKGTSRAPTRTSGCRFSALYPKEGVYRVSATLQGKDGVTGTGDAEVVVQDWLVFGLGDSNGSGEGTPDIPSPPLPELDPPVWQAVRCDRSANSFEARAALSLENRDPGTSVTFVHLACSGASIEEGLLGPYVGINPGPAFRPQLDEMKRLAGSREIDAVVISIGVNDLGFAELVKHCILYPACQNRGFPSLTSPDTLGKVMKARIGKLPDLFAALSHELKAARIPARSVYLSEYFDSTRNQNGEFCDPLIRVDARTLRPYTAAIPNPFLRKLAFAATSTVLDFDQAEARWANESVLTPLNAQVRAAATLHGWRLIDGVASRFTEHGYCSSDPWIVGLFESLERQHDHNGTLHATTYGNRQTAVLALRRLLPELYPGGSARRPGPWRRRDEDRAALRRRRPG